MTKIEAIRILAAIAANLLENAQESFPRRLQSSDTDEILAKLIADDADWSLQDLVEVRDGLIALDVLAEEIEPA